MSVKTDLKTSIAKDGKNLVKRKESWLFKIRVDSNPDALWLQLYVCSPLMIC